MDDGTIARPVAAFDIDGTLIREQLLSLFCRELTEYHIFTKASRAAFRSAFMEHRDRKITYDVYQRQLIDLFNERIRRKLKTDVEAVAKIVVEKNRDWLYVFSKKLLDALKPTHNCITITGALAETVNLLAPYWGFEQVYATELEVKAGMYTGKTASLPVADKRLILLEHVKKTGTTLEGSVSLGDTETDIPMLALAERPIAFNPNLALAAHAEKERWPNVVERKDNIYVHCSGVYRRFAAIDAHEAVRFVLTLRCGAPKKKKG